MPPHHPVDLTGACGLNVVRSPHRAAANPVLHAQRAGQGQAHARTGRARLSRVLEGGALLVHQPV